MSRPAGATPERQEIERKYLLDRLPDLPRTAEAYRIEQGYLPPGPDGAGAAGPPSDAPGGGRIRRMIDSAGDVVCTHTIKSGHGVRRTEIERTISPVAFQRAWAESAGSRLLKTRYRVPAGGEGLARARALCPGWSLVWEIDVFDRLELVLAELEIPSVEFEVVFPPWLASHVVREVTDEPAYRNVAIAVQAPAG